MVHLQRWQAPNVYQATKVHRTQIGLYTGMTTILAAIRDIERFPSPARLVGYAGLGARVHASGDSYQTGKISKQGRRELRTVLVTSAWIAVRFSDHWQRQFDKLAARIGKQKAISAIARKLLVVIWHVLTKKKRTIKLMFNRWPGRSSDGQRNINWLAHRRCIDMDLSDSAWPPWVCCKSQTVSGQWTTS